MSSKKRLTNWMKYAINFLHKFHPKELKLEEPNKPDESTNVIQQELQLEEQIKMARKHKFHLKEELRKPLQSTYLFGSNVHFIFFTNFFQKELQHEEEIKTHNLAL
jgi:lysyl-tRNA synthetase class I